MNRFIVILLLPLKVFSQELPTTVIVEGAYKDDYLRSEAFSRKERKSVKIIANGNYCGHLIVNFTRDSLYYITLEHELIRNDSLIPTIYQFQGRYEITEEAVVSIQGEHPFVNSSFKIETKQKGWTIEITGFRYRLIEEYRWISRKNRRTFYDGDVRELKEISK